MDHPDHCNITPVILIVDDEPDTLYLIKQRLENQLEWYKWEDRLKSKDRLKKNDSLFMNLHASFYQGAGLGSMIMMGNILEEIAEKQENRYIIPEDVFDSFLNNIKIAEKSLDIFREIGELLTKEFDLDTITLKDLYSFIKEITEGLGELSAIDNHKIMVSELKEFYEDEKVKIKKEYFKRILDELLINAFKFSDPGTNVPVIIDIHDNMLFISVINTPLKDSRGRLGIPIEYEKMIFEPFIRLTKTSIEEYRTSNYGLGLTYAEKIINKFGGTISATNIIDYSDLGSGNQIRVAFTVKLPLVKGES